MSDPEHWSELFGESLVQLLPASGWRLDLLDRRGGTSSSRCSDGLDPAHRGALERAVRGSRTQIGPGNTTYDWHDAPAAAGADSEPGLKVFAFRIAVSADQDVRAALLLGRHAIGSSSFGTEFEFLGYCRRMIAFYVAAAEAMCQAEIFRQIAKSISLGGIVADRNGRLVMNIAGKGGAVSPCLKPVLESPESTRKLLRQVVLDESRSRGEPGDDGDRLRATEGLIATGGQNRSVLHVIPVRDRAGGCEDGRVLFAVLEPLPARCPSSQSLRRVYALTPAEARVVERLVRGLPVKEISRVLKLSDNTVRTYLKRSFEKVGVSSQQQLIYEVAGMATEARSGHRGAFGEAAAG